MFTGIIQEIGKIQSIKRAKAIMQLEITASKKILKKPLGASIAVDGACFTITKKTTKSFIVEAMPETIKKTIIQNYQKGTEVNLETSLAIGDTLDGHFVSGHIDTKTTIKRVQENNQTKTIEVNIPTHIRQYCAVKGSITINGVSLTINKKSSTTVEVSLIPFTIKHTNLGNTKKGDEINLEVDLISRYLAELNK